MRTGVRRAPGGAANVVTVMSLPFGFETVASLPLTTLTVDERPVRRALVALALAALAGAVAALAQRKDRPMKTALARRFPAILAGLAVANALAVIAWAPVPLFHEAASRELAPVLEQAAAVVMGASVVVALACTFAAMWPRRSSHALSSVLFAGLAMTIPVHVFAERTRDVVIEEIGFSGYERVHVGETIAVSPVFLRQRWSGGLFGSYIKEPVAPIEYGWKTVAIPTLMDHAGAVDANVALERPYLRLTSVVRVVAGEDAPAPELPLAVGNTWHWELVATHSATSIWLGSHEKILGTASVDATVTRETREDGIHVYTLVVRHTAPGAAPSEVVSRVYGWNGETFVMQSAAPGNRDVRLVDLRGARCAVAFFPRYDCSCGTTPKESLELAGPDECRYDQTSGVGLAVDIFAFIVTLGLAPVGSDGTTAVLTSAHH